MVRSATAVLLHSEKVRVKTDPRTKGNLPSWFEKMTTPPGAPLRTWCSRVTFTSVLHSPSALHCAVALERSRAVAVKGPRHVLSS